MEKNNEIYTFEKITSTNNILNFKNGIGKHRILIEPKYIFHSENLVIIPVAPTELIARIAVRSTWHSIKETSKGKTLHYIFYMGTPKLTNGSYPLQLLYEEANKYNDILLFDIENSYIKCTLLLLVCYRYVVEKFSRLVYLIRVNSDMIFYPQKLDKMLDINEDVIGYKTNSGSLIYLSGSFYILKRNYVRLVVDESKYITPFTFYDDIFCGQINRRIKLKSVAYVNDENYYIPVDDINQNMLFNKSSPIIGAHTVNSNAILFFWMYSGYKLKDIDIS